MSILIGLSGKKGSGKSTAAKFLLDKGFTELSFAEPLKRGSARFLQISDYSIMNADSYEKELKVPGFTFTYREFLQKVGTFIRNEFSEDHWCKLLDDRLVLKEHFKSNIVVSDIRFDNEFDTIKNRGGIMVMIVNDNCLNDDHISEKGLNPERFDVIIKNDGSFDNFKADIDNVIRAARGVA